LGKETVPYSSYRAQLKFELTKIAASNNVEDVFTCLIIMSSVNDVFEFVLRTEFSLTITVWLERESLVNTCVTQVDKDNLAYLIGCPSHDLQWIYSTLIGAAVMVFCLRRRQLI